MHSYIDRLSQQYESPFRVWLGPILLVFIADAENIEILLKSKDCLSKPETLYKTIKDGLGVDGLITLKSIYPQWTINFAYFNLLILFCWIVFDFICLFR